MATFAPPLRWQLSGLRATIPWRVPLLVPVVVSLVAVLLAMLASWATARRIRALNILEGLRPL